MDQHYFLETCPAKLPMLFIFVSLTNLLSDQFAGMAFLSSYAWIAFSHICTAHQAHQSMTFERENPTESPRSPSGHVATPFAGLSGQVFQNQAFGTTPRCSLLFTVCQTILLYSLGLPEYTNSDGLHPSSDGLQPNSGGLQPKSESSCSKKAHLIPTRHDANVTRRVSVAWFVAFAFLRKERSLSRRRQQVGDPSCVRLGTLVGRRGGQTQVQTCKHCDMPRTSCQKNMF